MLGAVRWRRLVLAAAIYLAVDRWKPWPLDGLEALPGALGVMGDDIGAALFTLLSFLFAEMLTPSTALGRARP